MIELYHSDDLIAAANNVLALVQESKCFSKGRWP